MNHVDRAILGVIGGVTLVNFILLADDSPETTEVRGASAMENDKVLDEVRHYGEQLAERIKGLDAESV